MIIKNPSTQKLLYWLFNLISPNINAQVIITYILSHKNKFCKNFIQESTNNFLFKSIGDDTIGWNITILILHILLLLLLLILIDSGLIQFSFLSCYELNFDENQLDNDVLIERQRVLTLETNDEQNDCLIVNNLVKYYPTRQISAINHLTFAAKRGEAFGLLGYNVK